jgi:mxaJ protein
VRVRQWLILAALLSGPADAATRELKVCADPNNLPFSDLAGEGFENAIVRIVAGQLHAHVRYVWWAQRRGNVRETLNAGRCDLIPGVASNLETLGTTRPYYRSTYVAVVRDSRLKGLSSFDDPRLARLRIGVQLIGDDGANTPPAHALSRRGMVDNVRGFAVYGDYRDRAPQAPIFDALAKGEIDVAFAWGPTAAYFARREPVALFVMPVAPQLDGPLLPMVFDVSMGVRKDDLALRRQLDAALDARRGEVRAVLTRFGVPLVEDDAAP